MKYTFVLLFLFFISFSFAQQASDIKITYAKKDASLQEIFEDLESQYGVRFSYATSSIENKKMDAKFKDVAIHDVLDYLLASDDLEYKIVSNNILLRKSDTYSEDQTEDYKNSLHIKGKITNNQKAKASMEFATISISNTSLGTYSDSNGRFDIEIPMQYQNESLVISFVGYEDEVYKIEELEDAFMLVSMKSDIFSFEEVMIVNNEKPIKFGNINNSIQLNSSSIKSNNSNVMGNDLSRQIQLLPGISAHDDNSAAIKIRGSNSDETLMILDGMPIYNASHYYGVFSSLNTMYVDSVNIFKNTYPLQYGGKTGGLIELFSDIKQPLKTKGTINLDLLTASGNLVLPISDNSSLSIAGRSTIKEVNNKQFNTSNSALQENFLVSTFAQQVDNRRNDPSFTFYDINAKYQYKNKSQDIFSLNFFKSSDDVVNRYNITVNDIDDNELKLVAIDDQRWSSSAASMRFSNKISSDLEWNSNAYYTKYSNQGINDFKLDKNYKPGTPPPPVNNPLVAIIGSNQYNNLTDLGFDTHIKYYQNKQSFEFGINGIHHDIGYHFEENKKIKFKGKDIFMEFSGYAGYNIELSEHFSLSTGLRATYFANIEEARYSPRLLLNYQPTQHFLLKSSFHIENQVVRQFYYEYRGEPQELWVSAGQNDVPVLRSQNLMIGTTLKMKSFCLDVELYQKDMKGTIEYLLPTLGEASNSAEQNREYQLFQGNGISRGIDIILSSGYKRYDTYLSYTLSKTEEQYEEIFKNQFFASENDRTHQLKWVNTLSAGAFTFGLNGIYVSGRPYTDIRNVDINDDVRDLDPNIRLRRVKAYHRIDISTDYGFKIGKIDASISASVFNLMNTKNVKYIQSIATQLNANQKTENLIVGNESELLNRTFNIGLKIKF